MNNSHEEPIFSESQRFRQWWLWLLIIALNAGTLGMLITRLLSDSYIDSDAFLFNAINCVIVLGITLLFLSFRLQTLITAESLQVRFFPFHLKYRTYRWDIIRKAYIREYKPLTEYGGWGIRGFGNNTAFNISGNQGLQLEFTDGKKLLIGTRKTSEIRETLRKLEQLKA